MTSETWLSGIDQWPRALPEFEVRLERAGLLLVDLQNYLTQPEHGLSGRFARDFPEAADAYFDRVSELVIPNNQQLLRSFRAVSRPIVFLAFGAHRPDSLDAVSARRQHDVQRHGAEAARTIFPAGTWEHAICDQLEPASNEPVLTKVTSGGFLSTGLDMMLRNLGVTDLVIAGLLTNGCVESTMNEAADRGYRVVVVEDACGSFDMTAHYATLRNFRRLRGLVESTSAVMQRLDVESQAAT
jgi:nicotinamidase-related amidase